MWPCIHATGALAEADDALSDPFDVIVMELPNLPWCPDCRGSTPGFLDSISKVTHRRPSAHARGSPGIGKTAVEMTIELHRMVETKLTKRRWLAAVPALAPVLAEAAGTDVPAMRRLLGGEAMATRISRAMVKAPTAAVLAKRAATALGPHVPRSAFWSMLLLFLAGAGSDAWSSAALYKWMTAWAAFVPTMCDYAGDDVRALLTGWTPTDPPPADTTVFDLAVRVWLHGGRVPVLGRLDLAQRDAWRARFGMAVVEGCRVDAACE